MKQILFDDMKFKNGGLHFITKKYIYQMSLAGVFEKIKETNISE